MSQIYFKDASTYEISNHCESHNRIHNLNLWVSKTDVSMIVLDVIPAVGMHWDSDLKFYTGMNFDDSKILFIA